MFGSQPQMTLLNQPSYFGFNRGFVGGNPAAANQPQAMNWSEYFERKRMAAEKKRMLDQEMGLGDREMTLKEALGQSQMRESARSGNLAQSRLGLDANVANADANNRANALSLQERLGMMGENRLANSDQMQQERAGQELSLRERLGMMSENRLAKGADQDEAFRYAQMGQQAKLAELPYKMQDANSRAQGEFQNRQLSQQDKQFDRQFTDMPLSERFRSALAAKQQQLDQSNTDRAFNDLSAGQRQTGELADKQNSLQRDLQAAQIRADADKWNSLSAAQKAQNMQFKKDLDFRSAQFRQGQANFETERSTPSWMQKEDIGLRREDMGQRREMFDEGQRSEDWREAGRQVQGDLDRTSREKMSGEGTRASLKNSLMDFAARMQNVNPEVSDAIEREMLGMFGSEGGQVGQGVSGGAGQRRSSGARRNLDALNQNAVNEDIKAATGGKAPTSIEEANIGEVAQAESLVRRFASDQKGFSLAEIRDLADQADRSRNKIEGTVSVRETLDELLKKWMRGSQSSDRLMRQQEVKRQGSPIGYLQKLIYGPDTNQLGR